MVAVVEPQMLREPYRLGAKTHQRRRPVYGRPAHQDEDEGTEQDEHKAREVHAEHEDQRTAMTDQHAPARVDKNEQILCAGVGQYDGQKHADEKDADHGTSPTSGPYYWPVLNRLAQLVRHANRL